MRRATLRPLLLTAGGPVVFPDPRRADDEGLVAIGGDLSVERLLLAYRSGIFPWYDEGVPPLWWSPNPRAVFLPGSVHVSRSLHRRLRQSPFELSYGRAFERVIQECGRRRAGGTWILPEVVAAYGELYRRGHAFSVEAWSTDLLPRKIRAAREDFSEGGRSASEASEGRGGTERPLAAEGRASEASEGRGGTERPLVARRAEGRARELVGGVYGVQVGGFFAAESMFHRRTDASKVALVSLLFSLFGAGIELVDVQFLTPHLASLGAVELSRSDYLGRLERVQAKPVSLEALDVCSGAKLALNNRRLG